MRRNATTTAVTCYLQDGKNIKGCLYYAIGIRIIPPETFVGVAVAVVMYYFEGKMKESLKREIATLREKLKEV